MKISIVTAAYNSGGTIAHALDSVLSQVGADVELIVIDGGSSDGTLDIVKAYPGRLAALVSEPDRGVYDALNKGIALARGDVIGFLHSDDCFAHPEVLRDVTRVLGRHGADAVYGDLVYVRRSDVGRVVRYWRAGQFCRASLRWGWMPPHPTFFARRAVYERLGGFDLRYRIAADYDALLRFLGRGNIKLAYIPEVLVKMRTGGTSNRSLANILQKSREDYLALRRNGIGGLGTLACKNLRKVGQFLARDPAGLI